MPGGGFMGLAEWFSTFCGNIQVTNASVISQRYKAITKRLNTDFWSNYSDVYHSLYVGSYGRNTAIQGFSDLDMIFELPSDVYYKYDKYQSNGQSALLQAVKSSITTTYSTTSIRGDGQVIVITFSDGLYFEVVPVFSNQAGSYTFPNANNGGSWCTTNPRPEIQAIRERNASCNYNLIPLCRMMRMWKSKWNVPIGGLLIDTLAYQFIQNWGYKDKSYFYYDFMCRDFFQYMATQSKEQEYWKAPGSGQYVWGKGLFQNKAKQCYELSLDAINYENQTPKKEWSAKQNWREIFGTSFPN